MKMQEKLEGKFVGDVNENGRKTGIVRVMDKPSLFEIAARKGWGKAMWSFKPKCEHLWVLTDERNSTGVLFRISTIRGYEELCPKCNLRRFTFTGA